MKVIDLLNKMANGERLPNKIKLDGKIWTCKEDKKYYNQCEIELIDWYGNELQSCLNDYLELIEDETIDIDNIEEIDMITEKDDNLLRNIVDNQNLILKWAKKADKEIKELKPLDIEISEKDINEAIKKAREQLKKEIKELKEYEEMKAFTKVREELKQ